jgi:chromate reductase
MPSVVVFAGSTRKNAYSGQLADAAVKELKRQGADVTYISLKDYPLPIMDQDLEAEEGIPENAYKLARLFAAHQGLLIASPEYNASIPPLLKNTLDWVSRISEDNGKPLQPTAHLTVALCSSSPGGYGGLRGLYHLRAVMMMLNTQIISEQCSVSQAHQAFNEDGAFRDERTAKMLSRVCSSLLSKI